MKDNFLFTPLSIETTQAAVRALKHTAGLHFGLIAGLSFTVGAWGLDAIGLFQAHALFPWLKLVLGLVYAVPVSGLAGWLSARLQKTLVSILIWIADGAALGWAAGRLSFSGPPPFGGIYPALLKLLDPQLQAKINYPFYDEFLFRVGAILLTTIALAALAGLLELIMVDSATYASAPLARWLPLCLAIPLFLAAGVTADGMVSAPARGSVFAVDRMISLADRDRLDENRSTTAAGYLITLDPLKDQLGRPYRLILATYDSAYTDVYVLVDFGGRWGECRVFYSQPVSCEVWSPGTSP